MKTFLKSFFLNVCKWAFLSTKRSMSVRQCNFFAAKRWTPSVSVHCVFCICDPAWVWQLLADFKLGTIKAHIIHIIVSLRHLVQWERHKGQTLAHGWVWVTLFVFSRTKNYQDKSMVFRKISCQIEGHCKDLGCHLNLSTGTYESSFKPKTWFQTDQRQIRRSVDVIREASEGKIMIND